MCFFFFNDTATTEIYTLPLHDALPICAGRQLGAERVRVGLVDREPRLARGDVVLVERPRAHTGHDPFPDSRRVRSRPEEHTSELQSQSNLVCRLLLEKKRRSRFIQL